MSGKQGPDQSQPRRSGRYDLPHPQSRLNRGFGSGRLDPREKREAGSRIHGRSATEDVPGLVDLSVAEQAADQKRPSLQLHVGVGGDYWLIGPQQEDGDGDLIYTYYNGSSYDSIAYLDPHNDVWVEDSDIRLKKNIEPMGSVVDRLNQLEPVLFNLIKHEEGNAKKIGFIAQDVKKIFPDAVLLNVEEEK